MTKKKRHTCYQCGRKLVETKMKYIYRYYLRRVDGHWICGDHTSSDTWTLYKNIKNNIY